jgi:hypothetical protein
MKTNIEMTSLIIRIGFLIILSFISCNSSISEKENDTQTLELEQDYSNKSVYNIKVGDTLMIYYSTNSCCSYCAPNKNNLNHLKLIEERLLVPEPEDCMGCNHTSALVFVAKNIGTDTIFEKIEGPTTPCSDTLSDFNTHIVNIR